MTSKKPTARKSARAATAQRQKPQETHDQGDAAESRSTPPAADPRDVDQGDQGDQGRTAPPVEEVGDLRDAAAFDGDLSDWVARENLDATQYRATLYRYDQENAKKQSLVNASIGSILTAHDVGLKYGSGDYRYVVTWRLATGAPKIRAFRFSIGREYDALRVPAVAPVQPAAGLSEALSLVSTVFGMLLPIIKAQATPPASAGAAGAELAVLNMHKATQQVLQQSLLQYVDLQKSVREKLDADDRGDDFDDQEGEDMYEDEGGDPVFQQIKTLAAEWLPKILGDGLTGKAAALAVKSLPEFKAITRDKARLSRLLDELAAKFGDEEVDQVCARLKIKRPARAEAVAAAA